MSPRLTYLDREYVTLHPSGSFSLTFDSGMEIELIKTKVCLINCCAPCLSSQVEVDAVVGGWKSRVFTIQIREES